MTRRLLVVEGVYAQTGDIAPLDQVVALKDKYKYRWGARGGGPGVLMDWGGVGGRGARARA